MTLTDAKTLLEKRRIPYRTAQYEDEAAYWLHLMPFPDLSQAGSCKVTALVIPAVNGVKDIELQFNRRRGEYHLKDLWFGGYGFDISDTDPDLLEVDILDIIGQIVDGKMTVVIATDLKKKRLKSDCCFDLAEDDTVFGAPGYRETMARIEAPRTFWQKLTKQKIRYDIYNWRTHRQIVK